MEFGYLGEHGNLPAEQIPAPTSGVTLYVVPA